MTPRRTSQGEVDGLACGKTRDLLYCKVPGGPKWSRMTALVLAVLGSFVPARASLRAADPRPLDRPGLAIPAIRPGGGRMVLPIPRGPVGTPKRHREIALKFCPPLPQQHPRHPWSPQHRRHRTRVVHAAPSYPSASQQIIGTIAVGRKSKAPPRPARVARRLASFTGICRGVLEARLTLSFPARTSG